jgi:hypothetical protein
MKLTSPLYSLITLENFKALTGTDDRDDTLARFCLLISTHTIEQHCMRRFLQKRRFERIDFSGDLLLPLKEYPVTKLLAVYALSAIAGVDGVLIESDFYTLLPETEEDIPYSISLSPAIRRLASITAFKAVYWSGYTRNNVPADLSSACLELASWNMTRYKSRRIGMTGTIRGQGKDGEHLEPSMPENVKALLKPYQRRTI